MGIVVRFARRHARTSKSRSSKTKKSSAVTAPSVARAIFSATSREGQPLPSQSDVIQPPVTPIDAANSPRLMPLDSRYSASFMADSFSSAKNSVQVKFSVPVDGPGSLIPRKFSMGKAQPKQTVETRFKKSPFRPTFIRQWRKHRGLTIEKLAERSGMSNGNLSNIERGKTGYNQETLEAIAEALQCSPADLIMRDPSDPSAIWSLWDSAKPAQQQQIIGIIEGLLKSSAA
jgi:transcriptional regulator with XRE-family HTH domain